MEQQHQSPEEWAREMGQIQERAARARRVKESSPNLSRFSLEEIDAVLTAHEEFLERP